MDTHNVSAPSVRDAPPAVFEPYEKGFVGRSYDPNNPQRWRTNEGNPLGTTQPNIFAGVRPRQNCPGMLPADEEGVHYCTRSDAGYCDRRSGTCFCFEGYASEDCSECSPAFFRNETSGECVPRVLCPKDCSGAGSCDHSTGVCTCDPHRRGEDCAQAVCPLFDPFCSECDSDVCRRCLPGYFLREATADEAAELLDPSSNRSLAGLNPYLTGAGGSAGSVSWPLVCETCTVFDPRCSECTAELGCVACADPLLSSIRRSGRRARDQPLPFDEYRRELSRVLPFGTKDAFAFEEAESFFLSTDHPLAAAGAWVRPARSAAEAFLSVAEAANSTANRLQLQWYASNAGDVFAKQPSLAGWDGSVHDPLRSNDDWLATDLDLDRIRHSLRDRWFFDVVSPQIGYDDDATPVSDQWLTPLERTGWRPSSPRWRRNLDEFEFLPEQPWDENEGLGLWAFDVYSRLTDPCEFQQCDGRLSEFGGDGSGSGSGAGSVEWAPPVHPLEAAALAAKTHENVTVVPLDTRAQACDQGVELDARWRCAPFPVSHKVCGHPGTIQWASPAYAVREDDRFLRVAVRRSGGGLGRVSVRYDLRYESASAADLSPVATYLGAGPAAQTIVLEDGMVQASILLSLHDDLLLEGNETALLVLHDATDGAVLGAQWATRLTIVDDDERRVSPQCTALTSPAGLFASSWTIENGSYSFRTAPMDIQPPTSSPPPLRARALDVFPIYFHARRPGTTNRSVDFGGVLTDTSGGRTSPDPNLGGWKDADGSGEVAAAPIRPCALPGDAGGLPPLDSPETWPLGNVSNAARERFVVELWPPAAPSTASTSQFVRPRFGYGSVGGVGPGHLHGGAGHYDDLSSDTFPSTASLSDWPSPRARADAAFFSAGSRRGWNHGIGRDGYWAERGGGGGPDSWEDSGDVGSELDGVGSGPLDLEDDLWSMDGSMTVNDVSGGEAAEGREGAVRSRLGRAWSRQRDGPLEDWTASVLGEDAGRGAWGFDEARLRVRRDRTSVSPWWPPRAEEGDGGEWTIDGGVLRGRTAIVAPSHARMALEARGFVHAPGYESFFDLDPVLWARPPRSLRRPPVVSTEAVWGGALSDSDRMQLHDAGNSLREAAQRGIDDAIPDDPRQPRLAASPFFAQTDDPSIYAAAVVPAVAGRFDLHAYHAQPGGLRAEYFADARLTQPPMVARVDHGVNFTWNLGAPAGVASASVSARWHGKVELPSLGTSDEEAFVPVYFYVSAGKDDHARLWIDFDLAIDAWGPVRANGDVDPSFEDTQSFQTFEGFGTDQDLASSSAKRVGVIETAVTVPRVAGEDGPLGWRAYGLTFLRDDATVLFPNASNTSTTLFASPRPLRDASALVYLRPGRLADVRLEWRDEGHPHAACRLEWEIPQEYANKVAELEEMEERYGGLVNRGSRLSRRWRETERGGVRMAVPPSRLFAVRPVAGTPTPLVVVPGQASTSTSVNNASTLSILDTRPLAASLAASTERGLGGGSVALGPATLRAVAGRRSTIWVDSRDAAGNSRGDHGAADSFRLVGMPVDAALGWAVRKGLWSTSESLEAMNASVKFRTAINVFRDLAKATDASPLSSTRSATQSLASSPGFASVDIDGIFAIESKYNASTTFHRLDYTPEAAGMHLVWVQLWSDWEHFSDLGESPYWVAVDPAPVFAATSNISGPALDDMRVGDSSIVSLTARDWRGNPVPYIDASSAEALDLNPSPSHFDLQVAALDGSSVARAHLRPLRAAATSVLDSIVSAGQAVADRDADVTARNEFLSTWYGGFGASDGEYDTFSSSSFLAAYQGAVRVLRAGWSRLSVTLDGVHVRGSPVNVFVRPGPSRGERSEAVGGALSTMVATQPNIFTVLLRDEAGNPLWNFATWEDDASNVEVFVRVVVDEEGDDEPAVFDVHGACDLVGADDNGTPGNGTSWDTQGDAVRCTLVPPSVGRFHLHVAVKNESLGGFPRIVTVIPGPALGNSSAVAGSGIDTAVAGRMASFVVQPRDGAGNPADIDAVVLGDEAIAPAVHVNWSHVSVSEFANLDAGVDPTPTSLLLSESSSSGMVDVIQSVSDVSVRLTLVEAAHGAFYGAEESVESVDGRVVFLVGGTAPAVLLPRPSKGVEVVHSNISAALPLAEPALDLDVARSLSGEVWREAVDPYFLGVTDSSDELVSDLAWAMDVDGGEDIVVGGDALGLWRVEYVLPAAGVWKLEVWVRGQMVGGFPRAVYCHPGDVAATKTVMTGEGLRGSGSGNGGPFTGVRHRVRSQLRDAMGNDIETLQQSKALLHTLLVRVAQATFGAAHASPILDPTTSSLSWSSTLEQSSLLPTFSSVLRAIPPGSSTPAPAASSATRTLSALVDAATTLLGECALSSADDCVFEPFDCLRTCLHMSASISCFRNCVDSDTVTPRSSHVPVSFRPFQNASLWDEDEFLVVYDSTPYTASAFPSQQDPLARSEADSLLSLNLSVALNATDILEEIRKRLYPSVDPPAAIVRATAAVPPKRLEDGAVGFDYTPLDASNALIIPLVLDAEPALMRRVYARPGFAGLVEAAIESRESVSSLLQAQRTLPTSKLPSASALVDVGVAASTTSASLVRREMARAMVRPLWHEWSSAGPYLLSDPNAAERTNESVGFSVLWEAWIRPPYSVALRLGVLTGLGAEARVRIGEGLPSFASFPNFFELEEGAFSVLADVQSSDAGSSESSFSESYMTLESNRWYPLYVEYHSLVSSSPEHSLRVFANDSSTSLPWSWLRRPHAEAVDVFEAYTAPNVSFGALSTAEGPALEAVVEGETSTALVEVRDAFGNTRVWAGDNVSAAGILLDPWSSTEDNVPTLREEVEDLGAGMYEVSVLPGTSGRWELDVLVDYEEDSLQTGTEVAVEKELRRVGDAPFLVLSSPGDSDGVTSYAYGPGLVSGIAGEGFTFAIRLIDSDGNNRTVVAGDEELPTVQLSLRPGTSPNEAGDRGAFSLRSLSVPVEVKLGEDGLVHVSHNATVAGLYDVKIWIDGKPLRGSPYLTAVAPAPTASHTTTVAGLTDLDGFTASDVDPVDLPEPFPRGAFVPDAMDAPTADARELHFAVVLRDAFGNRRAASTLLSDRSPSLPYPGAFPAPLQTPSLATRTALAFETSSSTSDPPQLEAIGSPPGIYPTPQNTEQIPFGDALYVLVEGQNDVATIGKDGAMEPGRTSFAESGAIVPPSANATLQSLQGVVTVSSTLPSPGFFRVHVLLASGEPLVNAGGHGLHLKLSSALPTNPLQTQLSPATITLPSQPPFQSFALRGYVRAPFSSNYIFAVRAGSCHNVLLSVGPPLTKVLQQQQSPSNTQTSCALQIIEATGRAVLRQGQLYPLALDWSSPTPYSGEIQLLWKFEHENTFHPIPTSLLYSTATPIKGSPFDIQIN